jgi:hypothetical protein
LCLVVFRELGKQQNAIKTETAINELTSNKFIQIRSRNLFCKEKTNKRKLSLKKTFLANAIFTFSIEKK